MELKPIQTPNSVKILGKIILEFLFDTNFKFSFDCSMLPFGY